MSNLIAQVLQSTWYGKKTKLSLANTGAPGAHASLGRASICRPSPTEASSRQKKKLLPQNWHLTCTRLRLIVDQALKTLRSAPKASKKKTFPGLSFKMSPVKKKLGLSFKMPPVARTTFKCKGLHFFKASLNTFNRWVSLQEANGGKGRPWNLRNV